MYSIQHEMAHARMTRHKLLAQGRSEKGTCVLGGSAPTSFLMVAEHSKFHGARWVTALLVLLAVGGTLDYEIGERYVNFALEALYSKDSVKFDEVETKPGHHGSTGAMVNVYEIELNKYKIDDPEVCQSGSGPMEENEPNDVWTGVCTSCSVCDQVDCKASNLQAVESMNFTGDYDYSEAKDVTLAENKVFNLNLQWSLIPVEANYVVKYVIKIMGYVDFVVHQLIIENKIMCFAVLWLLEPRRSYCTSAAGLVWQLASCFYGVAEGRIFQFTMFSMASVFGTILVATYMNKHVAKKEHMSRISRKRKKVRLNEVRKQLLVMIFIFNYSSAAAMEAEAMAQRLATLTEAATRAAMSAEQMLSRMQTMTSGSSGASEGLSAASRILKPPDTFSGDDPMTFASWRFHELVDFW